jgi:hypothetical protein
VEEGIAFSSFVLYYFPTYYVLLWNLRGWNVGQERERCPGMFLF